MAKALLIPAAGSATRLRGLPKFLLPTTEQNVSLLERHLNILSGYFDEVLIGINPDFEHLIRSVVNETDKIQIHPMSTKTMMETVINLAALTACENFVVVMPDTYFSYYPEIIEFLLRENPDSIPTLMCWEMSDFQRGKLGQVLINTNGSIADIRDKDLDCEYQYFWGVAQFSELELDTANVSDSHIGFMFEKLVASGFQVNALKISGQYFDCGTQNEYISMLKSNS
jgi:choline kinase